MTKTALITGASAGLGVEFARQLAGAGIDLILVARRLKLLDEVAQALRDEYGIGVTTVAADLANPDAPRELYEFTQRAGQSVDYLINNAGSAGPHLLEEKAWAPQAKYLELMMLSVTHLCHHFIPPMRERGFGRVLNVSSFAGRLPRPAGAHYGPSKAYLIALSEELNLILSGTGVHVSALCPGFTHTDFHRAGDLIEMKNAMPKFVWYEAETVVREGLHALEKAKPIIISGRLYRWLDRLVQSPMLRPILKSIAPGRDQH